MESEGVSVQEALEALQRSLDSFNPRDRHRFRRKARALLAAHREPSDQRLAEVIATIKTQIPAPDGLAPGEKLVYPTGGGLSGLDSTNAEFVDSFLYDDDDLDCLVENGQLDARYYFDDPSCNKCYGSRRVSEITRLSHSFAVRRHDSYEYANESDCAAGRAQIHVSCPR